MRWTSTFGRWLLAALSLALLVAVMPPCMRAAARFGTDGVVSAVFLPLLGLLVFLVLVIVARDKAEKALRRSEAHLRLALQAARQGIWQIDVQRRRCSFDGNSSLALGLGDLPQILSFDQFLERVHQDDRPLFSRRLGMGDSLFGGYVVEFRVVHPDGSAHWLRDRGQAFAAHGGDGPCLTGVLVEITQAKEAEGQLRRLNENLEGLVNERTAELKVTLQSLLESEERFRCVFEASSDCISIWSSRFECLYANQVAISRFGGGAAAGLDIKLALQRVPEVLALWDGRIRQVLDSGEPARSEDAVTLDGELSYCDMSALPLRNAGGKVFAVALVCRDVTGGKLAEERLRHAKDAAEVASRAKSEFIANMSHEIRTPLNSIMGFAQIMERQEADPRRNQYLQGIKASGKVLLDLINDILDLSKIEAGKLELEYVPLSFAAVLGEMAQLFASPVASKGLKLAVELDEGFPELLLFDETRLRQILLNLVGNAVKFTDVGRIAARATHSPVSESATSVTLEVEDSGIGIPADKLDVVFNSFEQAAPHGRKNVGTGLGLTITKRLVEMLGGTISARSREGEGSVFTVVWGNVALASGEGARVGRPAGGGGFADATAMIVNDLPGDRERLKGLLAGLGMKVIESGHDVPGVMALARQCRPSVVVVDLRAGAAQDARTIAALKGDASTKDIPVVATCSSALPPDVKADAFLSKPFGPEGLKSLLSRYIPRRRGEAKPKGLGVVAAAVGPQRGEDEVLRRLELEFLPRWNVRECFSVGELIAFSQDLLRLGEEGGVPPLVEWAEGLLQGASCFDLRLTEGKLERFPDLLEAVREKALEAKEQHG